MEYGNALDRLPARESQTCHPHDQVDPQIPPLFSQLFLVRLPALRLLHPRVFWLVGCNPTGGQNCERSSKDMLLNQSADWFIEHLLHAKYGTRPWDS